jgi:hypothetical protein
MPQATTPQQAFKFMLDLMSWALEMRGSNQAAAALFQEHALLTAKANGWDTMPLVRDFASLQF